MDIFAPSHLLILLLIILVIFGPSKLGDVGGAMGKAIRDFLNFRSHAVAFDEFKYRHLNPPNPDRCVTLVFDDDATAAELRLLVALADPALDDSARCLFGRGAL